MTLGRSRERKEREAASRLDNRREVQVLAHAAAVPMRDGSSWCVLAAWVTKRGWVQGRPRPRWLFRDCCVERRMLTNPSFTRTRTPS